MGMELLIAIITAVVIVILWSLRKDMSVGKANEDKAAKEEFAKEVRDWANEATEKMTVTVTETTEVLIEDDTPASVKDEPVAPKAKPAPKAPAKKVAAKKPTAAKAKPAPKAPAKKVAAPKKKVAAPKKAKPTKKK